MTNKLAEQFTKEHNIKEPEVKSKNGFTFADAIKQARDRRNKDDNR